MSELYGVFVDAVEQVQQNYVRPVTRRELMESALRGMLSDLDPHSTYINTSQWKTFRKQIEGKFGGVGMTVEVDEDSKMLKVVAPMVGTPAYAAGVMAGDIILDIDGKTTEGMTIDKAVDALQGQPGTPVKLNILHDDTDKREVITVTRANIEVPSVMGDRRKPNDEWDFMLDKDKKIGYIRITNFIQDTTDHVKDALDELKKDGMKGLILDLRDDPGGLLSAAVEISDLFVEDGKIVSTRGRNVVEKTFEAHKEGTYTGFPMAVLVNHNSASASEILSACLQDHDRAVVIGERSFGKGLGAEHPRTRGRQQRAQADRGELLAAVGQEHPPVQERQGHRRVGRLPQPRPRGQDEPRGIPRLVPRPPRPRFPLQPQQGPG